eukprot:scaffold8102_cov73-Cyclotella_meneghiniana.AAC.14
MKIATRHFHEMTIQMPLSSMLQRRTSMLLSLACMYCSLVSCSAFAPHTLTATNTMTFVLRHASPHAPVVCVAAAQTEDEVNTALESSPTQSMSNMLRRRFSRRRAILAIPTVSSIIATMSVLPQLVNADVTNKVASQSALRALTNLQTQLPLRLKPVAQSNNYVGVKQCLREPPLDGIRKNMLVLVRGGEDGPKAKDLLLAYKRLISSLEDIDATATLGMRKNVGDPFLLSLQYDEVEKALGYFIEVGSAAASIPLQEDGEQTKIGSIDVRSGEVTPRVL